MEHYQFLFENLSGEQKEILVALLGDAAFSGFEESGQSLKAFIPVSIFDEQRFNEVMEQVGVYGSRSTIEETNWNAEWEANFEPVTIPDPVTMLPFAAIRAAFHLPEKRLIHDIVVTPKMSFGTGHHATTYLMVERMSQLNFENKTVIDFGTGTAILAILAEKMGAAEVIALDNDDWSINNAMENIAANDCRVIRVIKSDTVPSEKKASIILANINLNVIISSLPDLVNAAEDGATILFSGILVKDKEEIQAALTENFIEVLNCYERTHWLCIETKCKKA